MSSHRQTKCRPIVTPLSRVRLPFFASELDIRSLPRHALRRLKLDKPRRRTAIFDKERIRIYGVHDPGLGAGVTDLHDAQSPPDAGALGSRRPPSLRAHPERDAEVELDVLVAALLGLSREFAVDRGEALQQPPARPLGGDGV